jgi:hypothetical protein
MQEEKASKRIVFLTSSYVNLAKIFAINNRDYDVFLVFDRKFPQDFEDDELDNFYPFIFDNMKLFEKDEKAYFDNLALFVSEFEPDFLVCSNFRKELSGEFLEFMRFRNKNIKILDVHHGNLKITDNSDVRELLDELRIRSHISRYGGEVLMDSHETKIKELKQKGLLHKAEEVLNLRLRNVVLSYHERTKVLSTLKKVINNETK